MLLQRNLAFPHTETERTIWSSQNYQLLSKLPQNHTATNINYKIYLIWLIYWNYFDQERRTIFIHIPHFITNSKQNHKTNAMLQDITYIENNCCCLNLIYLIKIPCSKWIQYIFLIILLLVCYTVLNIYGEPLFKITTIRSPLQLVRYILRVHFLVNYLVQLVTQMINCYIFISKLRLFIGKSGTTNRWCSSCGLYSLIAS
jgi:hypothetical protein